LPAPGLVPGLTGLVVVVVLGIVVVVVLGIVVTGSAFGLTPNFSRMFENIPISFVLSLIGFIQINFIIDQKCPLRQILKFNKTHRIQMADFVICLLSSTA
jgi:hypothetical protein